MTFFQKKPQSRPTDSQRQARHGQGLVLHALAAAAGRLPGRLATIIDHLLKRRPRHC